MSKKTKIWALLLITTALSTYLISPPRNVTIKINANPVGVQKFYLEIHSSRPNWHGSTVKKVFQGPVKINQKVTVSLDQQKILWFGRISASIHHPEYYQEMTSTNNSYIFPNIVVSPTAWSELLASNEKLIAQQVYQPDVLAYRDIPMSQLNYHLWFVKEKITDLYKKNTNEKSMQKSIDIMISNTSDYINGMLEENVGDYGETKEMRNKIEESHILINEIHKKIN